MENSLAKALPVAIGFMANLAGIGGIAKKNKDVIKKLRQPIDKAVEKVVGFVADKLQKTKVEYGGTHGNVLWVEANPLTKKPRNTIGSEPKIKILLSLPIKLPVLKKTSMYYVKL